MFLPRLHLRWNVFTLVTSSNVFTLVTSSMELSCFSSLALTPSAWLTGEEDEGKLEFCFKIAIWSKVEGLKEKQLEKKTYQQNCKTTKSTKGRPFSRDQVPTAIASKIWRISPRSIISVSCTSISYNITKASVYYLEYILFLNAQERMMILIYSWLYGQLLRGALTPTLCADSPFFSWPSVPLAHTWTSPSPPLPPTPTQFE